MELTTMKRERAENYVADRRIESPLWTVNDIFIAFRGPRTVSADVATPRPLNLRALLARIRYRAFDISSLVDVSIAFSPFNHAVRLSSFRFSRFLAAFEGY